MINLQPKDRIALINCAMGKIEADLCITNVKLVNVITGEIYPADVFVYDGFIAHVQTENVGNKLFAKEIIDGKGQYLLPGYVDAHCHIESSMMTPRNFAKGVVNHGTTTVITDPHEIANVYGVEGVKYMHEASKGLPMRELINIPSCVPAVPGLENAGAEFLADEINELAKLERVVGLAEVMDFLGVINCEDRMMKIVEAARENGLYLQGHAPFMSGRALSAYIIGGAETCHESRTEKEFLDKIRAGMYIDVRESSITKNAREAVNACKDIKFYDRFCACTDDREVDDILHLGHMNVVVKKLISCGMDEVTAIKSATINNANEAKLDHVGAIVAGYVADMQIVESLKELKPSMVIFEGEVVSKDGKLVHDIEEKHFEIETRNSVNVKNLTLDTFTIKAPIENGKVKVNVIAFDGVDLPTTTVVTEEIPVKDGKLDLSFDKNLKFVACVNRYGKGTVGLGVLRNFGTDKGAIASTVSHDSHNLTVVFDDPKNALIAANELVKCGGGMACVIDGETIAVHELRLAGLMSAKPGEEVAASCQKMKQAYYKAGLTHLENPLLRIVTIALPVIPNAKMSDLGIVDVNTKTLVPLFA